MPLASSVASGAITEVSIGRTLFGQAPPDRVEALRTAATSYFGLRSYWRRNASLKVCLGRGFNSILVAAV